MASDVTQALAAQREAIARLAEEFDLDLGERIRRKQDIVDKWHTDPTDFRSLQEALGLTEDEYCEWVKGR